jgi:hypothetical protein
MKAFPETWLLVVVKLLFKNGFDGLVALDAKTKRMQHYKKTLGTYRFGGQ